LTSGGFGCQHKSLPASTLIPSPSILVAIYLATQKTHEFSTFSR
jgi:hypothetical protein